MPCFYSSLHRRWNVILTILFLTFGCKAFADDIEIDLGVTPTPATMSKLSNSSTVLTPQSKSLDMGKSTVDSLKKTDPKISENLTHQGLSIIKEITVSSLKNGALVTVGGDNIPKPATQKISDKKILIKFENVKLLISQKLVFDNSFVKTIRSSIHGSTAWIVLDVVGIKTLDASKIDKGYIFSLNSGSEVKTLTSANQPSDENNTNIRVDDSISSNSSEKGLFARLIEASFKPIDKGIKLVLTADSPAKYTVRKLLQPEKLVIRFHGTKLEVGEKIRKFNAEDVEFRKGGLLSMELRQIGPQFSPISEAILLLVPGTINQIDRDMNQVIVTLNAPVAVEKPVEKKGDINQLVSMDIQSADLNAVIKTLASEAGFDVNLVSGPVSGVVNEKFKDVPLKTALANLLAPGAYDYEVQGNSLRIGPQATLRATKLILPRITEIITPTGGMTLQQFDVLVRSILKPSDASLSVYDTVRNVIVLNGTPSDIEDYKRAIKDLKLSSGSNGDRITRVVKLNYADPTQTMTILTPYLTPVGKVQQDPRNNNLVIWETATNMGVLLELIKELDVKTPQVLIESNIVEVDKENDLNLNFNWNLNRNTGDPTITGSFSNTLQNLAISNPSSLVFGTVNSGLNITGELDALETRKLGKIISRPRIATASGIPAEINSVENIVYQTTQQTVGLGGTVTSTITFTQLPLPIDLKITPRITDDGRITSSIIATVTSETGPPVGPNAPPPTSVQTATTTITTKNGDTIVIGGLVRDTLQDSVNGIPLLMNLPIIGTLFEQKQLQHTKVELVIFVTPTIIQD